jgi:bifunctional DNA primase/polymerase-like protein/primase-like protein
MASFGIPQTPLRGKAPFLPEWQKKASTDPEQLQAWYAEFKCNFGSVALPGGFFIFEADAPGNGAPSARQRFEKQGGQFTSRLMIASRPDGSRGHRYYKWAEGIENIGQNATVYGDFSVRANAEQCVSPGSIHPETGKQYRVLCPFAAPAAPNPQELAFWFSEKKIEAKKEPANLNGNEPKIPEGQRNTFIASQLGKIREATGIGYDALLAAAIDINFRRCEPPLDEKELETITKSISKYPAKVDSFREQFEIKAQQQKEARDSQWNREEQPSEKKKAILQIPSSALASIRLQDIWGAVFQPNGWTLDFGLPALVTAASVLVPRLVVPEGQIFKGDDSMSNLYTGLIGPVGSGKSQAIEWAAKAMGIWNDMGCAPHYFAVNAGSAEQLIDALDRRQKKFTNSVLINPDEWAQLFAKATIPNATFATFLTTSFYRKHQIYIRPKGKEVTLNLAMSFIGGIVEDEFDAVFNASSLGGVYDRFLFGYMPRESPKWDYRQYPLQPMDVPAPGIFDAIGSWKPIPVTLDGSVFEVSKSWAQKDLGRITEICVRVATIYASMDGRETVTGKDLERLEGLAQYQLDVRKQFQPNAGLNPDAQFANAAVRWTDKYAQDWVSIAELKKGIHAWEMKLGPNVAERALYALSRAGRIQLWINTGDLVKNPLPNDYRGSLPRIGLVRRSTQ